MSYENIEDFGPLKKFINIALFFKFFLFNKINIIYIYIHTLLEVNF